MTSALVNLPRDLLAQALGGNPRLVQSFEQIAQATADTQVQVGTNAEATAALQDASFLVLAPNDTLTGERVFTPGVGLQIADTDGLLTVSVDDVVAQVDGGHSVRFVAEGPSTLILPLSGTLATRSGSETLQNKTLSAPRVVGISDYADDTAAAAGGVPLGGAYRTGSVLKVRVA